MHKFPDASVKPLKEPWRSFVTQLRDSLEDWAKAVELPHDFKGLSALDTVKEIDIVMRYALSKSDTRSKYLEKLEKSKQIPLRIKGTDRKGFANMLRKSGRSSNEINRILGIPVLKKRRPNSISCSQAFGPIHVAEQSFIPSSEWIYTVTLTNKTSKTFNEIVLFYDKVNTPGIIFLQELEVKPNETRVFKLDVCKTIKSYVIGCFVNEQMVARIPASGQAITPTSAGQMNPADKDSCADSWQITSLLSLAASTYLVSVTNHTKDTFDEIALFYSAKNFTGIKTLIKNTVGRGQQVIFDLGACDNMLSYSMGFFVGTKMVTAIGDAASGGPMTPQKRSLMDPTDHLPCADSWGIYYT